MSQRKPGPGERARRIQSAWSVRALIVGLILSAVALAAVFALQPRSRPTPAPQPNKSQRTSNTYWLGNDPAELAETIKAARTAFNVYLKRDQAYGNVQGVANEFAHVNSEADLLQVFRLLATTSGDDYIGLLTNEQYQDRMARIAGATVGVDVNCEFDFPQKKYLLKKVGPSAEEQGLQENDEITEIIGLKIPKEGPNQHGIAQAVVQIMQSRGLLGSTFPVVVVRDGKPQTITLTRVVIGQTVAFEMADMVHPITNKPVKNAKTLVFHHLQGKTLLLDLYQKLSAAQAQGVQGMIVDLREIGEGDTETAARIAGMFLEKGPVGRFIQTTPEGGLEMRTYEIVGGKFQVRIQGPFAVGADGKIAGKAEKPDRVEVKDWPCNVFRGQVVAVLGRQTIGGGEAIAAAFTNYWLKDQTRTQTVSKFYTQGKGTDQTYFQLGKKYWLRLSTSFALQPGGDVIEGQLGPGPNVACPQDQDEHWFARRTLFIRMSTLEHPEFPADRPY